jgi:hypothetical protein
VYIDLWEPPTLNQALSKQHLHRPLGQVPLATAHKDVGLRHPSKLQQCLHRDRLSGAHTATVSLLAVTLPADARRTSWFTVTWLPMQGRPASCWCKEYLLWLEFHQHSFGAPCLKVTAFLGAHSTSPVTEHTACPPARLPACSSVHSSVVYEPLWST